MYLCSEGVCIFRIGILSADGKKSLFDIFISYWIICGKCANWNVSVSIWNWPDTETQSSWMMKFGSFCLEIKHPPKSLPGGLIVPARRGRRAGLAQSAER